MELDIDMLDDNLIELITKQDAEDKTIEDDNKDERKRYFEFIVNRGIEDLFVITSYLKSAHELSSVFDDVIPSLDTNTIEELYISYDGFMKSLLLGKYDELLNYVDVGDNNYTDEVIMAHLKAGRKRILKNLEEKYKEEWEK